MVPIVRRVAFLTKIFKKVPKLFEIEYDLANLQFRAYFWTLIFFIVCYLRTLKNHFEKLTDILYLQDQRRRGDEKGCCPQ